MADVFRRICFTRSHSPSTVYGPADWDQVAPQCAGKYQSPVNIQNAKKKKDLPELNVVHEQKKGRVIGTFTNNGHAPTFAIDKSYGTATLKGGPLEGTYELQQFHFHFGCKKKEGSEHTVKGKAFSAEVSDLPLLWKVYPVLLFSSYFS